jgi:hypothetical protein
LNVVATSLPLDYCDCLDVWPAGTKSYILCFKHMYEKATARSRSLDLQRELESSEKEGKHAELRTRSWRLKRRSGESDEVEIYSKILNFDQIYIEKYGA